MSPLVNICDVLKELEVIINLLSNKFLADTITVGGDFNARVADKNQFFDKEILKDSYLAGKRKSNDKILNSRGEILIKFMEEQGLLLLN